MTKYILFFYCFAVCNITLTALSEESPNIIFILTDDQRFDAIGYVGNELAHTPEMDKLAKAGTFFKNATVTTPICAASRASLLTGLYERTHRFNFQTGSIREEYMANAYPKLLKDAGYQTAFYGKYGIKYNGKEALFNEYETYDRNTYFNDKRGYYYKKIGQDTVHLTRYTGHKVLDYFDKTQQNQPFCLMLNFSAPHAEELYYLKADKQEINNLAQNPKNQKELEVFRKKCNQLVKEYTDTYANPPTDLSIEYIRDPSEVALMDDQPEFAWIVPKEAVFQTAYQILVASSQANIDNNNGDIWDSGQVSSNESSNVEYVGKPLQNGKKHYWKVRIWDEVNRLTEYSDSQSFQIGAPSSTITTQNIFQYDRIQPTDLQKVNEGSYFVDFGKAAFANMELIYQAKTADTLTVRVGEQLSGKQINRDPSGHIRFAEVKIPVTPNQTKYQLPLIIDYRHLRPAAVTLPDSFPVLIPYRYAEIENAQTEIKQSDLTQIAYHGYWDDTQSSFESSDDILNQVWEMCRYSIKATTFAGLYVDGDRERIPYEADAYLNQLSHYTTDREFAIARQTIEYFMEYPTWPTEWQQHVALMFYADYRYTGNTELIEKYYEPLKHKTLFELRREDGLISSTKVTPAFMKKLGFKDPKTKLKDIVDWPPAQKDTGWKLATAEGERDGFVFMPYSTVINCLFYQNMKIMAEFAEALGKTEEAIEFELMALQAKKSINEKLLDKTKGFYVDGEGTEHSSLHANMMAFAFNIIPEKHKKSVLEFIKSRGMACSVYGSQYLMEALYNANEADYALDLMRAEHDRSWYNMIKIGSTIALEAWDMKYKPNADWNHAWGAAPANIIPRYMWGIQPKTAGFGVAVIKPQMSDLKHSKIEVPTIKGIIKGEYKFVSNRRQTYMIDLPANMVAEFEVVNAKGKQVKLNGKKVSLAFGAIRLMPGVNEIELVKSF